MVSFALMVLSNTRSIADFMLPFGVAQKPRRHKITNGKESDKCDLCKTLWISQGRFTTESALPIQTLGHIQHTCEALSEIHTMAHHRCWRLIHGELSRLASPAWRFICINHEKSFRTIWTELAQEFPGYSITVRSKRYGMKQKTRRCNAR